MSAIASEATLQESLVFKGGNALDFVLQPNRSTLDLDFSLDPGPHALIGTADAIERHLQTGCRGAAIRTDVALRVHGVRPNPPGANREFVTFLARIGYALPDQNTLRIRMESGRPSPQVVPVEISINEAICAATTVSPGSGVPALRIATIEDIVSEKLRALLQQVTRNRQRPQDLLDIAVALRADTPPDPVTVARFLLIKAAARDVAVSRAAFHDPDLARRTRIGYDDLAATTRVLFIPFDEALADLLAFTDALPIPATIAG